MGKKHKKHHKADEAAEESSHERQLQKDPIRLVLKVGHSLGYSPSASPSVPAPAATLTNVDDDRKHKHHKKSKKKKKKRDRSRDGFSDEAGVPSVPAEESHISAATERPARQMPISELLLDSNASRKRAAPSLDQSMERRSLREPRQCTLGGGRDDVVPVNALNETLNYVHRLMLKRDNNGFFSFPVNDTIAPGYSTIIKQPMDLSTMKSKIDTCIYRNVMEYKADLKLICVNAMTYNHPETVYYKAAQKLLEYGMRTLSKERLSSLRKSLPFMATISDHELALDQDVDASDYVTPVRVQKKEKIKNYLHFEPIPDNLPAKDILALAQEASRAASDELAAKRPGSKMGFLRQREDGTTTLNFINPDSNGYVSEKERVITIGQMAGKLQSGTWTIPGFKEEVKNKVMPVTCLNYGPFASHAPSHDSAFANLTKEESNLLLSVYGSEMPMTYAKSIMDFVAGVDEHVIKMADALLDSLTAQKHSAALKALGESREKEQKEADSARAATTANGEGDASQASKAECGSEGTAAGALSKAAQVNFKSLRSLSKLGIDISFVDHFEQQYAVQGQLGRTSAALQELERLQDERLSSLQQQPTTASNPAASRWPSDAEVKLAFDVTKELSLLSKQVNPGDIVSTEAVRSALGIVHYGGEMSSGVTAPTDPASSLSRTLPAAFPPAASPDNLSHSALLPEPVADANAMAGGNEDSLEQYLSGDLGSCL